MLIIAPVNFVWYFHDFKGQSLFLTFQIIFKILFYNLSCIVEKYPYICCRNHMTMANTYMTNPRLNVTLYQDYLRATQDLSRIDRLRLIVKRTRKTLTNKIS